MDVPILKYNFFLFLLLFAFSCNQVQQEEKYKLPSEEDVNKVIQAVIIQDSLFHGEKSEIPLATDLYKLQIYFPDTIKLRRDPQFPWINNFYKLVGIHGVNAPFTAHDSSFLLYQNNMLVNSRLDTNKFDNLNFTTLLEQEPKLIAREKTAFYYFSIPLFNNHQSRAYVELKFVCRKLCGYGNGFVMEKRNGNWEIVQKDIKWYE
ncbi:hypothetical protein [Pontibacter sp. H249]|uniref:hypothetical protein n=1 Tax=Pontibacter sp. H249 TaxID=3133420 RepID=UPI0030C0EA43